MIRFICVAVFVVLFLILSIPLLIAEWIIGKFNMALSGRRERHFMSKKSPKTISRSCEATESAKRGFANGAE